MKNYALGLMLIAFLVGAAPECLAAVEKSENESHIKVPLKITNLPRGTLLTSPVIQGIEIQVHGPAKIRSRLSDLNLHYHLDLSRLEPGSHTVPIQINHLHLPRGLSIVTYQPRAIPIQLELEARKEVSITVFYKGTPAPGYFVAQTVAEPALVMLSGPKHDLEKIESVPTQPVDVSGISDSFKKEITLNLPDHIDTVTREDPILVRIEISEEIQTRHMSAILVALDDPHDRCKINPAYIDLDIKGPRKLLEKLSAHPDFRVHVDIKGLDPGVYVRRATIELPVGTTLIKVNPEIFTVTIGPKP